ncbi:MAG: RecQ family ATP-dependent DNA helicase [Oscillatoriaceae cyanobacterium]
MSDTVDKLMQQLRSEFRRIWGYEDFRPPQGEIALSLLTGQDALVVMPTGGGKSVCFQLPALLRGGLTIVVSPLVALMENQVQELRQLQLPAQLLHGEVDKKQRLQTLRDIEQNRLRLLYLSPETLLSPVVWQCLSAPQVQITGMILDEAHCLVQWGETFRPAYRRLGAVRRALLASKPPGTKISMAAFTATADPEALGEIEKVLQLQRPEKFLLSVYRSNLHLAVKTVWTPRGRRQQLLKFIGTQGKTSGLVYARSRQDTEDLARWLREKGYQTKAYHAGLSAPERRRIEQAWLGDRLQFVVCTSAFGMGVNKPNVRWVVHYQAPGMLSEYVQEAGRAGRDGFPSIALTLASEPTGLLEPADRQRWRLLNQQQQQLMQRARQLGRKLPQTGEVTKLTQEFPDAAVALSLLHSAGVLEWRDPFRYQMLSTPGGKQEKKPGGKSIATGTRQGMRNPVSGCYPAKQIAEYLYNRQCRWQYLLRAFGFGEHLPCGHCDNCRSSHQPTVR